MNREEAVAFASVLEYPINPKSSNGRTDNANSTFKDIERVFEVPDENGNPSFYIVNYVDEGFIIISADNRTNPIRAFSVENKFPLDEQDYPMGLINWLLETNDLISDIRLLDAQETQSVAQAWDVCEMQKIIQPIDDGGCGGGGCENRYTTVGPLLSTTWEQTSGYNDLVQNKNCPSGTAPTGCVATAMAQIMKHHEFPNNYNWTDMPDNRGTMETARLMQDIGQAVNMQYTCTLSGAHMEDATSAFSSVIGKYKCTVFGK